LASTLVSLTRRPIGMAGTTRARRCTPAHSIPLEADAIVSDRQDQGSQVVAKRQTRVKTKGVKRASKATASVAPRVAWQTQLARVGFKAAVVDQQLGPNAPSIEKERSPKCKS
jgi:hypothetical protein